MLPRLTLKQDTVAQAHNQSTDLPGRGEGIFDLNSQSTQFASEPEIELRSAGKATAHDAPLFIPPKERFLEFRLQPSGNRSLILGALGAIGFLAIWQAGHYLTPESARKFLPSIGQVVSALYSLFAERNFLHDVLISCWRIFVSFLAADSATNGKATAERPGDY